MKRNAVSIDLFGDIWKKTRMSADQHNPNELSSSNTVDVTRRAVHSGPAPATVKRRALKILNHLGCTTCELSVVLCNDSFIRQLNRDFRDKDAATDVLSFPLTEHRLVAPANIMLGDIVISLETARRQADELGGGLLTEVTSLLVHGVLHLMGYTHDSKQNETEMNKMAIEILNRL